MDEETLKSIKAALEALGLTVYYGAAGTLSGEDVWDYIVFYRREISPSTNKTGLSQVYEVAIVCEGYVPDDKVFGVIDAMTALPGMRFADTGGDYQYTTKPNTEQVIEILTLDFTRPMKRCAK